MKTKTPIPSEHNEQVAFVNWFRATYPGVLIFAIPNGGIRHAGTALKLKQEGVVPGIPDLYVPAWSLWIEMKRSKGGRMSPDQKMIIDYLQRVGHIVVVAAGADDAIRQVVEHCIKDQ